MYDTTTIEKRELIYIYGSGVVLPYHIDSNMWIVATISCHSMCLAMKSVPTGKLRRMHAGCT